MWSKIKQLCGSASTSTRSWVASQNKVLWVVVIAGGLYLNRRCDMNDLHLHNLAHVLDGIFQDIGQALVSIIQKIGSI